MSTNTELEKKMEELNEIIKTGKKKREMIRDAEDKKDKKYGKRQGTYKIIPSK